MSVSHPTHRHSITTDLTQPGRTSLRAVLGLHLLESVGQMASLWLSATWLELPLNYDALWWLVGGYTAWNVASWCWYRRNDARISSLSLFLQLLVEMLVLTGLLYLSGGFTNPFVSLYLVPVALAATILRPTLAVPLGVISIVLYSALTQWYVPLGDAHMMHDAHASHANHAGHMNAHAGHHASQATSSLADSLHFFGMWVNYVISAVVVMVFLGFLAQLSRKRAQQLADAREKAMRDQQVVAIGGLAASAAHSLSTPLSTVAMVLDELSHEVDQNERSALTQTAQQQIATCRSHLSELLRSAGKERLHQAKRMPAKALLEQVLSAWRLTRPNVQLTHDWEALDNTMLTVDATLPHCLNNLLDNAADASLDAGSQAIHLTAKQHDGQLVIHIDDQGDGQVIHQHQPPSSQKSHGHGAGLLLTRSNMERMGGTLRFVQRDEGCRAVIHLPVSNVRNDGTPT